jgi:hypothetical protein
MSLNMKNIIKIPGWFDLISEKLWAMVTSHLGTHQYLSLRCVLRSQYAPGGGQKDSGRALYLHTYL